MGEVLVDHQEIHHPAMAAAEALSLAQRGELYPKLSEEEQRAIVDRLVQQHALLNHIEDSLGL